MYIDFVPNRGSKPAILLRESIREGKRIKKRTIANLSALTLEQAEAIRLLLKGEKLAPAGGALECIRSLPHGHVEAVRIAMRRLGFEKLIDGEASRERDLRCGDGCKPHRRAARQQAGHEACSRGYNAGGGFERCGCP